MSTYAIFGEYCSKVRFRSSNSFGVDPSLFHEDMIVVFPVTTKDLAMDQQPGVHQVDTTCGSLLRGLQVRVYCS